MKAIKELSIKDWSGYFFTEMDMEPEYFIKDVKMIQQYLMCVIAQKIVYLTLFLIAKNVFLEKVVLLVI